MQLITLTPASLLHKLHNTTIAQKTSHGLPHLGRRDLEKRVGKTKSKNPPISGFLLPSILEEREKARERKSEYRMSLIVENRHRSFAYRLTDGPPEEREKGKPSANTAASEMVQEVMQEKKDVLTMSNVWPEEPVTATCTPVTCWHTGRERKRRTSR